MIENFIYYCSVWCVCYAECTNEDTYLSTIENRKDLFAKVTKSSPKNLYRALTEVLETLHPHIIFNYGLHPHDIEFNAAFTQVYIIQNHINNSLRTIDSYFREYERQCSIPLIEYHDPANLLPAASLSIAPYLRSKFKSIPMVHPEFRLVGSNGALQELKAASGLEDCKALSAAWAKKINQRIPELDTIVIQYPGAKVVLGTLGVSNNASLMSGVDLCSKISALALTMAEHVRRRVATYYTPISLEEMQLLSSVIENARKTKRDFLECHELFNEHSGVFPVNYLQGLFYMVDTWDNLLSTLNQLQKVLQKIYYKDDDKKV